MTIFALFSGSGDGRFREFHIKDKYKTVGEALKLFKDDELLSEPGESFTFAWPGQTVDLHLYLAMSGDDVFLDTQTYLGYSCVEDIHGYGAVEKHEWSRAWP